MEGVGLIASERLRQVMEEGWNWTHDDEHENGELALAAVVYATPRDERRAVMSLWPWDEEWYKPGERIRELVKAGALIAAEIDRLQRVAEEKGDCEGEYHAELRMTVKKLRSAIGAYLSKSGNHARDDHSCELCEVMRETNTGMGIRP